MKIDFDEGQREVAAVAASFLGRKLPTSRLRELAADSDAPALDDATWSACAEMGWFGLGIPEAAGGVGLGVIEEAALFIELGRHLAPGPFLPTVAAAWVCSAAGATELTADLLEGRRRAGLVAAEYLLDAAAGDLAVEFSEGRCAVSEVRSATPCRSIDPSVRLGWPELGSTVAVFADPLVLPRAQVLVAAMELGIAQAVRDMSVAYAKTRFQFGVAIGSFQAVKHRCADMTIRAYAAEGQLMYALCRLERRAPDSVFHAASTRLVSAKAAAGNAADNVQNHGAIGFTQEHDAGLYSRRAHVLEFLLGGHAAAGPDVLEVSRHRFDNAPDLPADWWHPAAAPSAGAQ